ncbi:hypothetical protein PENTCL1PPCAC_5293, partial [Pristionchus entomophagus]
VFSLGLLLQYHYLAMTSSQDEGFETPKGGRRKNRKADEVFCYCREPEGNRFMIGCDACDEWYHGECIQISRTKGREIDKYYCPTCVSKNPELTTTYKKKDYDLGDNPVRCTECINCIRTPDCGECTRCISKDGRCMRVECLMEDLKIDRKKENEKKQPRKTPATEMKSEEEDDDTFSPPSASTSRKAGGSGVALSDKKNLPRGRKKGWKKDKSAEKVAPKKAKEVYKEKRPGYESTLGERLDKGSATYAAWEAQQGRYRKGRAVKAEPEQCWGPGCVNETRDNSKYCSDDCGKALAKVRLMEYLPKGLANYWRLEPAAVRQAREEEERRTRELEVMQEEKKDLDKWYNLVINYVDSIKQIKPDEADDDRKEEGEMMINCPVCAVEYGSRSISKHIERCFIRMEKQTTYGTNTKCNINPHDIFCEEFNKSNNTYCKRLRVVCPEHYKGDIEAGLQICGWPKVWTCQGSKTMDELFHSTEDIISNGLCSISRKECKQHCGWVTSILGSIDARRIAFFHKYDEVCEARNLTVNSKKGNAWLLMANQTEYHQPLEKILHQYKSAAERGGETVTSAIQP